MNCTAARPHAWRRGSLAGLLLALACLPGLARAQVATAEAAIADAAAARAVQARLSAVAALRHIAVNVDGGVAVLEGEVLAVEQRKRAGDIAAASPGVSTVDNRLALDTSLRARLALAYQQMTTKLVRMVAAAPLLLVAALIVVLAVWLGGVVSRRLHWLRLRTDNPYMDGLARRVVQTVVVLAGVLVALDLLGATSLVGAVLGSAGVVGLVLGFAFKDIAENYVAGVLLSLRRPFAPGDHVVVEGNEGKVIALSSRATILMTLDGSHLLLPNSVVFKSVLLNYSRNPKRRFDFTVWIDGTQSIRAAQTLALAEFARIEGMLADPAPSWMVVENAPAGIQLRFFGWVDQTASDLGKVRGEAIRMVKAAFAREGIEPPRTVQHVVLSREPRHGMPATVAEEPAHAAGADTSVNRDIDGQLAAAQQVDESPNLLDQPPPPA